MKQLNFNYLINLYFVIINKNQLFKFKIIHFV